MHSKIRPLGNSLDKKLCGATFTHRFWPGKQVIVCGQVD